ncbi:MloB [Rhodobacteraceae bacterium KLH11]|nr:MloB [Rhodobacteraceae bacterium KLH11]
MVSEQQIISWQDIEPENENLEFKEAKHNFHRDKLYKYVVALANEGGGHIVLGMTDKRPRKIVGTTTFQDLNVLKSDVRTNVGFNVQAQELIVEGKRILAIRAPSRPKGTAYQFKGAYYMRCGEDLVPMSEDRLREIFGEDLAWDKGIIRENLTELEVCELLDTKVLFEFLELPISENIHDIVDRLKNMRLLKEDGSKLAMTNTAAVVLAKDLNSFPELIRKAPRLIVYNGVDKLDTRIDITGQRGYAAGFQGLVRQCMQHMPQNEVIENALRRTVPLFPERAMREIIANALIHQDFYATGGGPLVEIYPNRVEVSNPGKPVVPVERFIDGHKSRNEFLAWIMRQLNICEERSSGIDRVVGTAEMFQLPAPEFIQSFESTTIVVYGPRDFQKMTSDDKVRACYQHCALKYVVREHMTNESLCGRFGLDESGKATASKIIKATVGSGLVSPDPTVGASRKYARYVPSWSLQDVE